MADDRPVWRQGFDAVEAAVGVHDLFVMSHFVDDTWATLTTTGVADLVDG